MWPWILIPLALIALLILYFVLARWKYYGRMFSPDHFREVHEKSSHALRTALNSPGDTTPSQDDGTVFVSSAGLMIALSKHFEEGRHVLHVSMSQPGAPNTHVVANHFGCFFLSVLNGNVMELNPFYSQNGVHHLVFTRDNPELQINPFEQSYAHYRQNFHLIPYQPQHVDY